jgi:hypothetical protein
MARLLVVILLVQAAVGGSAPPSTLDYASFKTRVLPLLVERCASCHASSTAFRLQPLPPGRRAYTEEEARRNFEAAARMVVPGVPLRSPLLTMPLAHAAGGTDSHTGGKYWTSQDDPEWKALAEWVKNAFGDPGWWQRR